MLDELIEKLNETGVTFVRDAWTEFPETDYGVCVMEGEPSSLWGDDTLVCQQVNVNVYLYNRDGTDTNAAKVQEALKAADVSFVLSGREYLQNPDMIRWTWRVQIEKWY